MSKYIKLEDAIDGKCPVEDIWEDCIDCPLDNRADEPCKMGKWLKSLPTIDIVRCKECKFAEKCEQIVVFDITENQVEGRKIDFCSYGERIEK